MINERFLKDLAEGCRILVLCATALEAEPMLAAMTEPRRVTVATKEVIAGRLKAGAAASNLDNNSDKLVLAITGCDKTNTAHLLTCLLQAMDPLPGLVLQSGIAGALPFIEPSMSSSALPIECASAASGGFSAPPKGANGARPGDLVLATEEIYADTGSSSPEGWLSAEDLGLPMVEIAGTKFYNRFPLDAQLVKMAAKVLPEAVVGPFITVSKVSGLWREAEELAVRWGAVAESMEGAAAAHICALYEVPFLEVRGISNMVGDRDRSSWCLEEAVATASTAALALCRAFMSTSGKGMRQKMHKDTCHD